MRPQRIKHENAQSRGGGMSAGMKDMLITGAALGVGAIGGYYILDYIFKSNVFNGTSAPEPDVNTDTQADIARVAQANIVHTLPYDRTTRINSYGNTGISAYRGRKVIPRLPIATSTDIFEIDSGDEIPGFNQVFTEEEVIEVI